MSDVTMEDRLERVLARVTDWLKFAEAKNAALLTLDTGAVAGVIGWLGGDRVPAAWLTSSVELGLGLLVVSGLVTLASFLPVTRIDWLRLQRKHGHGDSVLFFGAIAGTTAATYLDSLRTAAGASEGPRGRLELDYATQIVVNAGIAAAKFRCFTAAAYLSAAAVIVVALRVVGHLLF